MKKLTPEEKVERLNLAWGKIIDGIKIIKNIYKKDKELEEFISDLEIAHSNLHRKILGKLEQKIFDEEK